MAADGNDAVHGAIHGKTPAERLLKGADALVNHRARGLVHYTQTSKRMSIVRNRLIPPFGKRVIYEDCSSGVTALAFMAGLHDPNECHFNGTGYTGTLVRNGRKVGPPYRVGDLVFYGGSVPNHVTMVYKPLQQGRTAEVWSHGHEGGPLILPMDYRGDRTQVRRYFKL